MKTKEEFLQEYRKIAIQLKRMNGNAFRKLYHIRQAVGRQAIEAGATISDLQKILDQINQVNRDERWKAVAERNRRRHIARQLELKEDKHQKRTFW